MNITPSFPLVGYATAGALLIGFGGGFYLESLRWDASLLKAQKAAVRIQLKQQAHVEKEATSYETERTEGESERVVVETKIRTIFRDRVVPGSCAAPDDVVRVLAESVERANARASGESGDELPAAPKPAEPIDRPRALPVGSNDDRAIRGLRITTQAYGPSLAEAMTGEPIPEVEFGR